MTGIANYFQSDTFSERRNSTPSAGVAYDPESLLTGAEEAAGLTYHDRRVWPSQALYQLAVEGKLTPSEVAAIAPRVKVAAPAVKIENEEDRDITEIFPGCYFVDLGALASGRVTL